MEEGYVKRKLHAESVYFNMKRDELERKHKESEASEELQEVLNSSTELLRECGTHLVSWIGKDLSLDERWRQIQLVTDMSKFTNDSLAHFEEKFYKYNVPRRRDSNSLKEYEERMRKFMEIWDAETEKGRKAGARSLTERLQELGQEKMPIFAQWKVLAIELGIKISRRLVNYCWFLADSTGNLEEVETTVQCLTVDEHSILIDRFLDVLKFVGLLMSFNVTLQCRQKMEEVRIDAAEESEILRLILREVLRLEVALCCPDLEIMPTDQLLISMAFHLEQVIENKLSKVGVKVDKLIARRKQALDADSKAKLEQLEMVLELRIKGIWAKLDLHPEPRSC